MVTHIALLPVMLSLHFETALLSCYIKVSIKPSTPLVQDRTYPDKLLVTTSHTVFRQDNSTFACDFSTYTGIQDNDVKIARHMKAGFHISPWKVPGK